MWGSDSVVVMVVWSGLQTVVELVVVKVVVSALDLAVEMVAGWVVDWVAHGKRYNPASVNATRLCKYV